MYECRAARKPYSPLYLLDGQKDARFVIDRHHADENGVGGDGISDFVGGNVSAFVGYQTDNFKSVPFQLVHTAHNRRMLDCRGDNALSVATLCLHRAENSRVIAFASAGGKINFSLVATDSICNFLSAFLQSDFRLYPEQMQGGRIAEFASHTLGHSIDCLVTERGSRAVIEIMNQKGTPLQNIIIHYLLYIIYIINTTIFFTILAVRNFGKSGM